MNHDRIIYINISRILSSPNIPLYGGFTTLLNQTHDHTIVTFVVGSTKLSTAVALMV